MLIEGLMRRKDRVIYRMLVRHDHSDIRGDAKVVPYGVEPRP